MFPIVFFCAYGREKIEAWHLKKKQNPTLKQPLLVFHFTEKLFKQCELI